MKNFFFFVFLLLSFTSLAQSNESFFWQVKKEKQYIDSIKFSHRIKTPLKRFTKSELDSLRKDKAFKYLDSLQTESIRVLSKLLNHEFPDATQLLNNEESLSTIYNDFTILNFHKYDSDTIQFEDLARLKEESCESMVIIAFLPSSSEVYQKFADRYKKNIIFVFDADSYIEAHDFGEGYPNIWILNKEKLIKYIATGSYEEKGRLCFELKNKMSLFSDTFR